MPDVVIQGQVGPVAAADGSNVDLRQGRSAELIVQELHGRFYEQNFRNALYSGGMGLTSIANATFTSGTLGATCTPIAGVWNPVTSIVNVVVLQAVLGVTMTALQATGGGPYVWAASIDNATITTGNVPLNRKSLVKVGSQAKDMSGVALTGLSSNLVVVMGSALGGGSASSAAFLATAAGMQTQELGSVENIDGGLIVPPGGVIALLATTTPVAHSAVSGLVWEEVPL